MALQFEILGNPLEDNALLVRIDSGQSTHRLLFDCGEGCLERVEFAELREIDHLFFSHFHMDHIAGFDRYFRSNYDRPRKNIFWGPSGAAKILQHRFRGYLWNLHGDLKGTACVHAIDANRLERYRFELSEAFEVMHRDEDSVHDGIIVDSPSYQVQAIPLNHGTLSIGYVVREKTRRNIDMDRLKALGLKPGPWLKQLKEGLDLHQIIEGESGGYSLGEVGERVITETPGGSIAYLSDFWVSEADRKELAEKIRGCRHLVCESQYLSADQDLADKHHHMTAKQVAQLAAQAEVEDLVLIHISSRYPDPGWREVLQEARTIFPRARFAPHWR